MRPPWWTNERATFAGEPIVSSFAPGNARERQLQSVMRPSEQANRIAAIRSYVFCPEVVREIGAAMELTWDRSSTNYLRRWVDNMPSRTAKRVAGWGPLAG